jgi:hypothetical protein
MEIPWLNIQGFSGATAVGSIVFVDLALIANAFAGNLSPPSISMHRRRRGQAPGCPPQKKSAEERYYNGERCWDWDGDSCDG